LKAATRIAILGVGSIGSAIAAGLAQSGRFEPQQIILTRRKTHLLESFKEQGFRIQADNRQAVREAEVIIITVEPDHLSGLLNEIKSELEPGRHTLISVLSGLPIAQIARQIDRPVSIVRAMPNTAIAVGQSMTCLASNDSNPQALAIAESIFATVGSTRVIEEAQMNAATALSACGVAFFLRAIRAAALGGVEIGFQADEAAMIAAQAARGAAALLLGADEHPEAEIDKVTTPGGCTISGLNQMEAAGFSAAMIKGVVAAFDKAMRLPINGEM